MNRRLLSATRNALFQVSRRSSRAVQQTPAEYCFHQVRKNDYENYWCTLRLPARVRAAGFAVRAFNVEVARIADQVHDGAIGAMRLRFWKDALDKTYEGKPPHTPVALELGRLLKRHKLSKRYFRRLVEARERHMRTSVFPTKESLERYAEDTASVVYYLLLEASEVTNVRADHAASHLGKAQGIVNLVRSVPHNARRRTNVLPQDVLMNHGVSTEAVLRGANSAELQNAVFEVASLASVHLTTAKSELARVERATKNVFLPVVCVETFLEDLRRCDFNVYDPRLQRTRPFLPLRLIYRSYFNF